MTCVDHAGGDVACWAMTCAQGASCAHGHARTPARALAAARSHQARHAAQAGIQVAGWHANAPAWQELVVQGHAPAVQLAHVVPGPACPGCRAASRTAQPPMVSPGPPSFTPSALPPGGRLPPPLAGVRAGEAGRAEKRPCGCTDVADANQDPGCGECGGSGRVPSVPSEVSDNVRRTVPT